MDDRCVTRWEVSSRPHPHYQTRIQDTRYHWRWAHHQYVPFEFRPEVSSLLLEGIYFPPHSIMMSGRAAIVHLCFVHQSEWWTAAPIKMKPNPARRLIATSLYVLAAPPSRASRDWWSQARPDGCNLKSHFLNWHLYSHLVISADTSAPPVLCLCIQTIHVCCMPWWQGSGIQKGESGKHCLRGLGWTGVRA